MAESSRERVLKALNHEQPDRLPVDFGAHRSSGIMAIAYRRLREHLGLPRRPIRVYDMIQQLALIDEDVLDLFGIDAVELGRGFSQKDEDWKPWILPDGNECLIPSFIDVRRQGDDWLLYSPSGRPVGIQRRSMLYFDQIYWPYLDGIPENLADLGEALADTMWSVPTSPILAEFDRDELRETARAFRESTDRAVVGLFGGNIVEIPQFLCRIDNFLWLMGAEPETVDRLLDRLVEIHLENLEAYLGAVGPYIDIVLFGDDMGMQSGPQFSPDMYRRYFKLRHAALWRRAKELADVKVMLHCCGGIRPLLDDMIEAGLDTTNPVQTSCAGMESEGIKRDFGNRLCLWGGGCDTQAILPHCSPREIEKHVLGRLETLSPGGGFIYQQVHNILADVPPENIVAMFETVNRFRGFL